MNENNEKSEVGIMDPEGNNPNPFNNKEYSEDYLKWAEIWKKFPAYQMKDAIVKNLEESQVNIIVSGTGSGKTVLLPKFLMHIFNYNKKIVVTLPKQIIAQSAAEFAAKTLDVDIGKEVGYKYRGSPKNMFTNDTKMLYATDGTIVAMLMDDPKLSQFDGVIIDEAHERKVQIDFLLLLLKKTVSLRKDFKLVIMSATINTEIFVNYFKDFSPRLLDVGSKTNYPIKSIFSDKDVDEKQIVEVGINIIEQIIKTTDNGDILFFVNSANEAKDVCRKINKTHNKTFCIEVYSGMDLTKQELAQDLTKYKSLDNSFNRKLVIATNVAESSLTIDGIEYVIDSGYELSSSYDPQNRAKILDKQRISIAQIKQRMGRAGRTKPGTCYHLYTKQTMDSLSKFPIPSIRKEDVTEEFLKIIAYPHVQTYPKLLNIISGLIEPPREAYITSAGKKLMELGIINKKLDLSDLGKIISSLNFSPNKSLSILVAKNLRCSYEVIKIISIIDVCKNNIGNIFLDPIILLSKRMNDSNYDKMLKSMKNKVESARSIFKSKYGDHISLLKLFEKYSRLDNKKKEEWTHKYFIKKDVIDKSIKMFYKNKGQLFKISDKYDIQFEIPDEIKSMDLELRILYCIALGLYDKQAKIGKIIRLLFGPTTSVVSRDSFINALSLMPANVMYEELFILMKKPELNIVTKIPNKIKELLPSQPSLLKCAIQAK